MMKSILLIGLGRFGRHIAMKLDELNHQVMAIDRNEERVDAILPYVHAKFLLKNGADEVIYPEKQMAEWAAIRYSADHILDYVELDDEHAIFEISVPENWVGRTVGQLDIRNKHNINIMAFKHMGVMNLNIKSDTPVPENNTMLVLGNIRDIQKCFHI